MRKKGFLLAEETLKIILGVIAIGFLIFFLVALYNSGKTSKDLEFAKSSLEHLVEDINLEVEEIEVFNPENWLIVSWPKGNSGIPLSCSNLGWNNCICIIKDINFARKPITKIPGTASETELLRRISDEGACLNNPGELIIRENIKIKDPPITLNVDYENKLIFKK